MEKRSTRVKSMFLKLLPKAASPVIFLSPPVSPVGDRRIGNTTKLKAITKGYSGPIVSMVPLEARRKSRNGSFDTREPNSPKVSCMGQIKKKKKKKTKLVLPPTEKPKPAPSPGKSKKNPFAIHKIFQGSNHSRKCGDSDVKQPGPDRSPSLSQMKRFASGRDAFMNFDWRDVHGAAVAPDNQNHCSDGKEGGEEKPISSFSAPIAVGGAVAVEPKKKAIDLWKRRTVPPPPPLQL